VKIQHFSAPPAQAHSRPAASFSKPAQSDSYTPEQRDQQDLSFNRALKFGGFLGWDIQGINPNSQAAHTMESASTGRNLLLAGGAAAGLGLALGLGYTGVAEIAGLTAAGGATGLAAGLVAIAFSSDRSLSCPENARSLFA